MDIERYAFDLWGVNVMNIPGMSAPSTLRLVAELGENFIDKFEDARHFVSWANLVPQQQDFRREASIQQGAEEKESCRIDFPPMHEFAIQVEGADGRLLPAYKSPQRACAGHGADRQETCDHLLYHHINEDRL